MGKGKVTVVYKHVVCSECEKTATKNENCMFYTCACKYNKETKLACTCVEITLLITTLSWGGSHSPYSQF